MRVFSTPAVVVAAYLCLMAALAGALTAFGWTPVWEGLAIPSMSPAFADLRTVQGALETYAQGGDPRLANPGDPWGRPFNYPPVWLWIGTILHLEEETAYRFFVGGYLAAFLATTAGLLWRFPSPVLLLACLSGAVLLGIERGNTDLLIFVLVAGAVALPHPWIRAGLILLATVLKLYPLLLLPLILTGRGPEAPRTRLAAAIACLGAAGLLLAPWGADILAGLRATPSGTGGWLSYGLGTLGPVGKTSTMITVLLVSLLCLHAPRPGLPAAGALATDALIAGALIWCGSYLLIENFDYRMVFLLLCLPALQASGHGRGRTGIALAVLVLASLNQLLLVAVADGPGFLLNTAAKLALMFLCLALALRTMLARAARIWPETGARDAWPGHGLRLPGQRLLEYLERA